MSYCVFALLGIAVLLLMLYCDKPINENFGIGIIGAGSFSCAANGCRSDTKGEMSEGTCEKVCKSWIRRDGKCVETKGAPWDSYASKMVCERAANQINSGTLSTV